MKRILTHISLAFICLGLFTSTAQPGLWVTTCGVTIILGVMLDDAYVTNHTCMKCGDEIVECKGYGGYL